MSEQDALRTFDFSKVTGSGLYVKFTPGESKILRVLTTDPIVTNEEYVSKKTGEVSVNTRFSFVVYNWSEDRAQIWKTSANNAKEIGKLHVDPDFGANIKNIDIKVTAPGQGEIKAYDFQVLPTTRAITNEHIQKAQAINLDETVKDGTRMSFYDPSTIQAPAEESTTTTVDLGGTPNEDSEEPIDISKIPF